MVVHEKMNALRARSGMQKSQKPICKRETCAITQIFAFLTNFGIRLFAQGTDLNGMPRGSNLNLDLEVMCQCKRTMIYVA